MKKLLFMMVLFMTLSMSAMSNELAVGEIVLENTEEIRKGAVIVLTAATTVGLLAGFSHMMAGALLQKMGVLEPEDLNAVEDSLANWYPIL